MSDAVSKVVELDLLKMIHKALKECADDLQCYLNEEYPEKLRAAYPTYQRRYNNQREPVVDALYCIDQLHAAGICTPPTSDEVK